MKYLAYILFFVCPMMLIAQGEITNEFKFSIENTIEVELVKKDDCDQCYYYLPANLKLSIEKDKPEISLIKWDKEGDTEAGGILHFLVHWELDKMQQIQLEDSIELRKGKKAVIMGSMSVDALPVDQFFHGEEAVVDVLNNCLNHMPPIATTPGAKMAFSFRLGSEDLKVLENYLDKLNDSEAELRLPYSFMSNQRDLVRSLKLKNIFKYLK